jgi:glycerophosphoryl diester phosphodiesterase
VFYRILKIAGVALAILLVTAFVGYFYLASFEGKRAVPIGFFVEGNRELLSFAHRGGAKEAPENTFAAFDNALDNGIDFLEIDVSVTKDGDFIVYHDRTLDRTIGTEGRIAEMGLDALQQLDAGYNFTADNGKKHPFRGVGLKIPTLREVLKKYPDRPFNIELKNNDTSKVKPFCELLDKLKRQDSVIIASTHTDVLETVRRECKGVATSASLGEGLWFVFLYYIGLSQTFDADMQALQLPANAFGGGLVTPQLVEAVHERGLKFHVFTIDDQARIDAMKKSGVDGVMTDRPSLKIKEQDLSTKEHGEKAGKWIADN